MIDAPIRVGMSLDDFLAEMEKTPFELIDGEKKTHMSGGFNHLIVIQALHRALTVYLLGHPIGLVFAEAPFVLPDVMNSQWVRGSRIPDVMFVSHEKFNTYLDSPFARTGAPFATVPELVVEVISPNDSYTEVEKKVDLYLQDGVRMIWTIDPQRKAATVYLEDKTVSRLSEDDVLSGGNVLPGFEVTLREVFAHVLKA